MKNKNLFQKIAFPNLIGAILLISAVPTTFSQSAMPAPKQEKLLNLRVYPDGNNLRTICHQAILKRAILANIFSRGANYWVF